MSEKTVEEVLKQYSDSLMTLPGVAGTAQGRYEGEPCIKVFATKMSPELLRQIPPVLGGYRVIVEETGKFRALNNEKH